jgi:hypothetical protein
MGPVVVFVHIFTIGYLGFDLKKCNCYIFLFFFLTSNLTDDFLLRFDGIAFSGFCFLSSAVLAAREILFVKSDLKFFALSNKSAPF